MSAMRTVFQPGRSAPRTPVVNKPPGSENSRRSAPIAPPPPLVVLVHGLESFGGTWDGVLARVSAQSAPSPSILVVDLRGHGWGLRRRSDQYR
jgi:pimeloyl-ACP methyl ester carboxylesterase